MCKTHIYMHYNWFGTYVIFKEIWLNWDWSKDWRQLIYLSYIRFNRFYLEIIVPLWNKLKKKIKSWFWNAGCAKINVYFHRPIRLLNTFKMVHSPTQYPMYNYYIQTFQNGEYCDQVSTSLFDSIRLRFIRTSCKYMYSVFYLLDVSCKRIVNRRFSSYVESLLVCCNLTENTTVFYF